MVDKGYPWLEMSYAARLADQNEEYKTQRNPDPCHVHPNILTRHRMVGMFEREKGGVCLIYRLVPLPGYFLPVQISEHRITMDSCQVPSSV